MGTLMNGMGIFVLTLVAVVLGGFINAKLHPLPDLRLDKDGKITAIVPVAAGTKGAEGGGTGKPSLRAHAKASHAYSGLPSVSNCRRIASIAHRRASRRASEVSFIVRPASRQRRPCAQARGARNAASSCNQNARAARAPC